MSFGIPVRNGLGIGLTPSTTLSSGVRGARPVMFLNFLNTTSLSGMVTFTRSTTATFTGSNGLIQTAAINAPRFDYDPVTLAAKGLLIEEQRTNLLTYSEQFDNAAWTKSAVTITANATAAPDGTSTADKFTPDVTLAPHFAGQTVTTTAVAHTYSAYLKAGGYSWAILYAAGVNQGVYFDLANGVVGSSFIGAPTSSSITPVGNGWYRCSITFTATTGTAARVYASSANTVSTFAGDGTSGIFLWGAQLEAGAFATSYIPTVASQVTRSADQASMTGTNFSSWYNQSEGSFVASYDSVAPASRYAINANDGTSNNLIGIEFSSAATVRGRITTAGVSQASMNTGSAISADAVVNAGLAYATNSAITAAGGALSTEDTSVTLATLTQLNIGAILASTYLNGHIRQIAYYNTRLPNATLQALTETPGAYSVDYLVVAGGGGGGSTSAFATGPGGGGAGGMLTGTTSLTAGVVYTATIGAGGSGGSSGTPASGSDGSTSSFNAVSTTGGGGGGGAANNTAGRAGGSGGGGTNTGGAGGGRVVGQGNVGGTAVSSNITGAGGGGAGAAGGNTSGVNGGAGGAGLASSITGASVTYAGGGGGSGDTGGAGGAGGGGAGVAFSGDGTSGTANRGGGGGGAGWTNAFNAGNGGSGVIILSVPTAKYTGTTTGSPTVTTSGANTILTFTSSGSYTA